MFYSLWYNAPTMLPAGIINKPLFLHLVGCLYYLYQWSTVKQISDNEIYLLIEYIKSILWTVAKHVSYTEDARCLKVNPSMLRSYISSLFLSLCIYLPTRYSFRWKFTSVSCICKRNNASISFRLFLKFHANSHHRGHCQVRYNAIYCISSYS